MLEKMNSDIVSRVVGVLSVILMSLYGALYLELFYESYNETSRLSDLVLTFSISGALMRFLVGFALFIVLSLLGRMLFLRYPKISNFIFRYRFLFGLALLVILVVCEISGSSIACLADALGYEGDTGVLFGQPREIRVDEFNVYAPMCLSQTFNNYDIYNSFLTGYPENVTMTYGAPTLSVVTFFRPFLWGYILFGAAKGLSFYWCARLIVLFIVTFEFGRILTEDNRCLSVACAILVTFAPMIQWWYSTAFTVEIILAGEALCVALYQMLAFRKSSFALAIVIPWLCGVYLFALYPAWQVSCFYIFALVGIMFAIDRIKSNKIKVTSVVKWRVFGALICSFVFFGILIGFSLYQGMDAVLAELGSVYPGQRQSSGGGLYEYLYGRGISSNLPLMSGGEVNQCELSRFFDLFPFAMVFSWFVYSVKKDKYLLGLNIIMFVYLLYGFFGFPNIVSKMLLLSFVTTKRLLYAIGFLGVCLLIRSLHLISYLKFTKFKLAVVLCVLVGNCVLILNGSHNAGNSVLILSGLLMVLIFLICFILCLSSEDKSRLASSYRILCCVLAIVVALPGLCVNPVQMGIPNIQDTQVGDKIKMINEDSPGVFASSAIPLASVCPYVGARSMHVQVYPLHEFWKKIDPELESEDAWNRYAHFTFDIKATGKPQFNMVQSDYFTVDITIDDLKKLGCDYYILPKDKVKQVEILDDACVLIGETDFFNFYRL